MRRGLCSPRVYQSGLGYKIEPLIHNTKRHTKPQMNQLSNWVVLGFYPKNGEGNGNPLQYSCLDNPMDGGAWWATVHGLQSQTQLSDFTFIFTTLKIHFAGSLPQLPNARAISATSGKLERKTLRTNGPNTCLGPCLLVFPDRGWLDTSSKAPALGHQICY